MSHVQELVCGVDGSEHSVQAVRLADRLARAVGGNLVLAHVGPPRGARSLALMADPPPIRRRQQRRSKRIMDDCARRAEVVPGRVVPLSHPNASTALAEFAQSIGAALLIVGSRGAGGVSRAVLGSVSAELPLSARCPVVVVPQGAAVARMNPAAEPTVVCGVDDSDASRSAAAAAGWITRSLRGRLALVRTRLAEPPLADWPIGGRHTVAVDFEALLEREQRQEVRFLQQAITWSDCREEDVEITLQVGDAADRIDAVARAKRAALIVVGSRRRGALRAAVLGSVSRQLAIRAARPVMIVPPGAGHPLAPPLRP